MALTQSTRSSDDVLSQVIERAWEDPAFRERLISDPRSALHEEYGLAVPGDLQVRVIEEAADEVLIVLPAAPYGVEAEPVVIQPVPLAGTNISGQTGCHSCCPPPEDSRH